MTKSEHSAKSEQAAQLITKAESCVNQYDWSSADYFYREAITFDETPASRIAYGVSLASREKFFAAITVFSPILDCDNRHAISIVCHNLAAIYRTVGDFDLARRFQWRSTLLQDH